jgi:hypothetical protein
VSALVDLLFPLPARRRTSLAILGWWESRRPLFNAAVGGAGLISIGTLEVLARIPPGPGHFEIPWLAVLAYAALANCCYSFGPLLEIAAEKLWGGAAPRVGPALFRQGLAFAVGLTLLPILIGWIGWLGIAIDAVRGWLG